MAQEYSSRRVDLDRAGRYIAWIDLTEVTERQRIELFEL